MLAGKQTEMKADIDLSPFQNLGMGDPTIESVVINGWAHEAVEYDHQKPEYNHFTRECCPKSLHSQITKTISDLISGRQLIIWIFIALNIRAGLG